MTNPNGPVVLPHLRLSWGGSLGNPAVEIWSNSVAWQIGPEAPSEAECQAIAAAAQGPLQAWVRNPNSMIGNCVQLEWIKAAWVLNNGKQRDTNTARVDLHGPNIAVGMMSPVPIWEQSYAITLRTALNRGAGHAGRIYPPVSGPAPENNATPYASLAAINGMTQTFLAMVQNLRSGIRGAINPSFGSDDDNGRNAELAIVSRATVTNPTAKLTPVTRIAIDRVADIQHRRTNRVARAEATTLNLA